jgi:hypothetical protein
MELMMAPQQPSRNSSYSRRMSVTVDEWAVEKNKLVAKLMCLKGANVWKFAREKILKQKWQNPAFKVLVAPGKGFIVWTGRKPVRFTAVKAGPSEALNLLMYELAHFNSLCVFVHFVSLTFLQFFNRLEHSDSSGCWRCQALHLSCQYHERRRQH